MYNEFIRDISHRIENYADGEDVITGKIRSYIGVLCSGKGVIMKNIRLGATSLKVPSIVVGCMRLNEMSPQEMNHYIHSALELGANFYDHADIYGRGRSEELFGEAIKDDLSIKREDMILQTKCGICKGCYDLSEKHILESVEESLRRLHTDYLDVLLLHRPDALVEPEEVASAFDKLAESGKVRYFGVSNHKPMQIELLKKYVKQELMINQLQLSIPVSNMIANGMEVNMDTPGSMDHDGSVLDYCRLHDITIQAWSPFQTNGGKGPFFQNEAYVELNQEIQLLAENYNATETMIATAWILRHPAHIQMIAGTTKQSRLKEIVEACEIELTREEWYRLYLAAGHPLP